MRKSPLKVTAFKVFGLELMRLGSLLVLDRRLARS